MNNESIYFGMALGVIMLLCLNWIYFYNWLNMIGWILSIISPKKTIKEIENERRFRRTEEYKRHQRKWKQWFLIAPVSFVVIYLLLYYITKQLLICYFGGILVILIVYAILSKYEQQERKIIEKGRGDGFA